MQIAFLACPETLPGAPGRRPDAFEHDEQIGALRRGLAHSGVGVVDIDWRAPLQDLTGYPLALLGTAWDYTDHPEAFVDRLTALEAAGVQVCNPAAMVRWNSDKSYLAELARSGVPSIPTLWHDAPTGADVVDAMESFGCERIVVKRRVGAGAIGQVDFHRDDPALADWSMGQAAMLQPFLPSIQSDGEYSFIFIDGAFSHALVKRAAAGDYRIQSLYGGTEHAVTPVAPDRDAAEAVVALLPFETAPLYARVDMVRGDGGGLVLIEAELIEPYLYPLQDAMFGHRLANAVLARL